MQTIKFMKNAVLSPVLLARALVTGTAALISKENWKDYERRTLLIIMLAEFPIITAAIVLVPKFLGFGSCVYYTGAAVMWAAFTEMYTFESKGLAKGESVFDFLGDTAILCIFAFNALLLLITGVFNV